MPVEPPHVEVLSDPAIVFIFVALFVVALTLALLFASPWLSRVPSSTTTEGRAPSHARAEPSERD